MNVNEAAHLARSLMYQHNVTGWSFGFDGAKRRLGQTDYTNRRITLSRHLTANRQADDVKNTILHEIAHVKAGHAAGHGPEWVRVAKSIGCTGERCGTVSAAEKVPPNWKAVCPIGHVVATRYRRPAASKRHSCTKCSPGAFDPRYLLRWVAA